MASGSVKVIVAALIGNGLIAVTKFAAAAFTGSAAMLSEGIHSLVDTGNQGLLLYGMGRSKLPPDRQFPFGHGKEIYFWSFVVAILIFAVGAGVSIWEGVKHMLHPAPIENVHVNYIVLGLSIIFESVAWYMAFREFNRTRGRRGMVEAVRQGKDPSLFVVLFEDSAAMAGLIIAMFGIWLASTTGWYWLDGLASVLIGLILAGTAIWLAIETKSLLIGEAADQQVVEGIRQMAADMPEVNGVNEVLTLHMGPDFILVNMSVDFHNTLAAEVLEGCIAGMDATIKQRFPRVKRIFVEAEARRIQPRQAAEAVPSSPS